MISMPLMAYLTTCTELLHLLPYATVMARPIYRRQWGPDIVTCDEKATTGCDCHCGAADVYGSPPRKQQQPFSFFGAEPAKSSTTTDPELPLHAAPGTSLNLRSSVKPPHGREGLQSNACVMLRHCACYLRGPFKQSLHLEAGMHLRTCAPS